MPRHDALFKAAFSNPAATAALVKAVLPRNVVDELDLDTLRVVSGNFVRRRLRERFADVLFSVRASGVPVLLHFLFEHKSRPDRYTVLDLLDNVAALWTTWRRTQKDLPMLPRVIPIVIHHGNERWNQPRTLSELLAGDEALRKKFALLDPTFPVVFVDLSEVDDPEHAVARIDDPLARCVLFFLIVSRMRDSMHHVKHGGFSLMKVVWTTPAGREWVETVLDYLLEFLPEDTDPDEFLTMVANHVDPEAEHRMRTLRDVFIDLGKSEGKAEAGIEAILNVLAARFGPRAESLRPRLERIRDAESLMHWVGVAATAPSLASFADELGDG